LDLLRPTRDKVAVLRQAAQQKTNYDRHAQSQQLHIGQQVMARNLRERVAKWASTLKDCLFS